VREHIPAGFLGAVFVFVGAVFVFVGAVFVFVFVVNVAVVVILATFHFVIDLLLLGPVFETLPGGSRKGLGLGGGGTGMGTQTLGRGD
jgi:hypothetical protein